MKDNEVVELLTLTENENNKKSKKKKSKKKKIIIGTSSGILGLVVIAAFLLYGPWNGFRNLWITTAMTTMNHQYLATSLYSNSTIQKVLEENSITEPHGKTDTSLIKFKKYKII